MSLANVALYGALLVFLVYRRVQGRPICTTRQLWLLPAVVTLIGVEDIGHATLHPIDVAVAVAGCVLSLGLGAVRGTTNRLSHRDGVPWVRWGAASLAIFAVNVAAKLVLDLAGVALGGSASGVTASFVLAAGCMLVGEAGVVWLRLRMDSQIGHPQEAARSPLEWR
jgi:hypothetical protein